ncbi:TDT family transporter [Gleimia sp. 6138-11-ORH1]|uniref:TDT family transporter n=1 Tax=Gleimia sp. 6138-11-ORH1 TaxID=2973937 RepID=UPI0021692021|nr:TDT family transporter [Gleimia sp. 6138-11-ORH1]MCS4485140.1 TDT family transporter [Gleimia sp. 6138-11-ORH1]
MNTAKTPENKHTNPPKPEANQPSLPPAGPVWFPSVMGTGILTTLLIQHAAHIPTAAHLALLTLFLAWSLLLFLTLAFLYRGISNPRVFSEALYSPAIIPFWGTVSMGYLSVGSATATAVPYHWPKLTELAWQIDTVMWLIGAAIGILSAFYFAIRMVGTSLGTPNFVWGLAVVGPMVAATSGANLSTHLPENWGPLVLIFSITGFMVSFTLGWAIFIQAYYQFFTVQPLPLIASASSWIPLGLVGQSTAAVQAFVVSGKEFATGRLIEDLVSLANWYGFVMFAVGTPLTLWATIVTIRGFAQKMPFTPSWWATTFPIGTLALGATALGKSLESSLLIWLGAANTLVLCATVTLSLTASLRAITAKTKLLPNLNRTT